VVKLGQALLQKPFTPAELLCKVHDSLAGARRVIIVADAHDVSRHALCESLGQAGFRALEAGNREELLALASQNRVDALLMDLKLSGPSASETIQQARAAQAGLPVVVTSDAFAEVQIGNCGFGADALAPKSMIPAALIGVLEQVCSSRPVAMPNGRARPEDAADETAAHGWTGGDPVTKIPRELRGRMRAAVFHGRKSELDELIAQVRAIDSAFARTLQELADGYEYDTLTRLFHGGI
jgi:CheY-like chemotaxis protein